MAELLALVYVRDVNLYHSGFQRTDTVVQGYAGVGVCTGVEHDAVVREAYLLHFVDELSLDIALEVGDIHIGILCLQLWQVLFERR